MSGRAMRMLATVVVVAIGAVACGDGSGGGDDRNASDDGPDVGAPATPIDIVKESIATTRESTSRISHHLISDITAFAANEYSEGVADLRTGDAQWLHDMSESPIGLVPAGTPPGEVKLRAREVGEYLFVSMPAAFEAANIDETWIRVPDTPPEGTTGFTGFEGLSPRIGLSSRFERPDVAFKILDTTSAAREVGSATIRGKETTRYSIDVKLRTMLEEVGLMFFFGDPKAPAELAEIDELCAKAAHVDVFIDPLGRIRELRVEADLSIVAPKFDPPQDPEFWRELRLEWDFYDYGVDVAVEAPTDSVRTG
jgi:hypothetical protein